MQRRSRLLLFSLAASAPVIGMMVAVSPVANASSAPSASARAHALTIARNYLHHLKIGQHATDHAVRVNRPGVSGLTQVSSTNWAGYADDNTAGNTYTSLSGNWTEPTGTCTSATSLAVFWVGIDGFTSGSVEQDGTLIECSGGRVFYFTWWEMFPTNSIQVVGSSVRPGTPSAPRLCGAARPTRSRSPTPPTPRTASPRPRPARPALTPARSGSPRLRAVLAASIR